MGSQLLLHHTTTTTNALLPTHSHCTSSPMTRSSHLHVHDGLVALLSLSPSTLLSLAYILLALFLLASLLSWLHPGGPAWGLRHLRHLHLHLATTSTSTTSTSSTSTSTSSGVSPPPIIPGPRGLPLLGSLLSFSASPTAHRLLASLASSFHARPLMALSLASSTRVVVSSHPSTARHILCNPAFSERPLSQSATHLLFTRALGFSPAGHRWRNLRRLAATHLFSPRRIAAHQPLRQLDTTAMLHSMAAAAAAKNAIVIRPFLQHAALNNIMGTVFGKRYAYSSSSAAIHHTAAADDDHDGRSEEKEEKEEERREAKEVQSMVREGFELLGAFNMSDHLPSAFQSVDPLRITHRCQQLVPRVYAFVQRIIDDHRSAALAAAAAGVDMANSPSSSFVDVLLHLQQEEKLADSDIVSILWEMIFRGTDTMAILTEWILAELALHPDIQSRLHAEVQSMAEARLKEEEEEEEAGGAGKRGTIRDADTARMPYLQAVVKETLRMHPPGPLLSWARLAIHDTEVGGYEVPAGTTAMVNMWAIMHDPEVWAEADSFWPERFLEGEGKAIEVNSGAVDMRLAPFGAGARACPGKAMAMATVQLWVARIVQRFELQQVDDHPIDLTEVLKLSCEMAAPLVVRLKDRPLHQN